MPQPTEEPLLELSSHSPYTKKGIAVEIVDYENIFMQVEVKGVPVMAPIAKYIRDQAIWSHFNELLQPPLGNFAWRAPRDT